MRTTLDIPEPLLEEARHLLGAKSKSDVVVLALEELVRKTAMVPLGESAAEAVVQDAEGDEDPLDSFLVQERARLLREALDELSPQMKRAVFLRVAGELKYREIAEETGVSGEPIKAEADATDPARVPAWKKSPQTRLALVSLNLAEEIVADRDRER